VGALKAEVIDPNVFTAIKKAGHLPGFLVRT